MPDLEQDPLLGLPTEELIESNRSAIVDLEDFSPEVEQHLLEQFEAETFEDAMLDEVNFNTFITMLLEIQYEIEPYRFAELLRIAVSATKENAVFFLACLDDISDTIEDEFALEKAEEAAKQML